MSVTVTGRERTEVIIRLRAAGCVFAEEEADLLLRSVSTAAGLEDRMRRREAGEPLELILGFAVFDGIRLRVGAGVFVPRRRSVLLAREVVSDLGPGATYLDLCTGTGAIAAAVRAQRPDLQVLASDIDRRAVQCAQENLPGCWVGTGDLFDAVPGDLRGGLDAITVNAPYVPVAELARLPREAREYEPPHSLLGGADGLDVHRRVVAVLEDWLSAAGFAVLEVGEPQCRSLAEVCTRAGLVTDLLRGDEGGFAVRACRRRR